MVADLAWHPRDGATKRIKRFHTGNAIFSTPVIDAEERIYVGSADRSFYMLDPHDRAADEDGMAVAWKHNLNGIIDSAACLGKDGTVYVPAGDGQLHAYTPDGTEKWALDILTNRTKAQFTFSSNYWFEGNVVLGPDGMLYAGNDDFFLYKIDPASGKVIWKILTGFFIWSAFAFSGDGKAYIAGFDQLLYAVDTKRGKITWKKDLHAALVTTPTIGQDGIIYQASFGGILFALTPRGKIKWRFDTGAHVYASPALGPDGKLFLGSTNGTFYALDAATGKVVWTYHVGDTIRSSASVGPDPEGKFPYLVYLGGGDGRVYALEPVGTLKWSYDTTLNAVNIDYPNINASIALGKSGLALASSTGDVLWIPYDAYLAEDRGEEVPGMQTSNVFKSPGGDGPKWHYISPGGRVDPTPVTGVKDILPIGTISLRLLLHLKGNVSATDIDPGTIEISAEPAFQHRFELQSNGCTLNIIPGEILAPGTEYAVTLSVAYRPAEKEADTIASVKVPFREVLTFRTTEIADDASITESAGERAFKIVYMAIPQPAIVPSLNQIGFASLTIPFSIIDADPAKKQFVAWAVQRFGDEGVPQKRVSIYPFSGQQDGAYFLMDAKNCFFEITSLDLPLDLFRIAGRLEADGTAKGGSLIIEKHWGKSNTALLRQLGNESPLSWRIISSHIKAAGLGSVLKASKSFIGGLIRQGTRDTWRVWGLINHRDHLMGIGTFKLEPGQLDPEEIDGVMVNHFDIDHKKHQIVADLDGAKTIRGWEPVARIVLVDREAMAVVPINYTRFTKQTTEGEHVTVVLNIPKGALDGHPDIVAHLLLSLHVLKTIPLGP
jgi:outer membrane protein assembly factor BamB